MSSFAPELWTALGAAITIFLSSFGLCYAFAYAGLFTMHNHAQLGIKSFFPVIIAGVLAIYGLILGCILAFKIDDSSSISERKAFHYCRSCLPLQRSRDWPFPERIYEYGVS